MKVIGLLLLLIAFGAFSIYGMSVTNDLMQSADTTIEESDAMHTSYTASKSVTTTAWGMSSMGVWFLVVAVVIVLMGGAVALIAR